MLGSETRICKRKHLSAPLRSLQLDGEVVLVPICNLYCRLRYSMLEARIARIRLAYNKAAYESKEDG